ncbi:hypothetical protein SJI19_12355 [Acerihabitans sp. TG2]|uniref:hypothetical protein n=1 Tax=Acerihabitans sp. TG2 TaxID=3096008 RepID=UPI002B23C3C8|nr:hypothetical protein [Acerihabitans sp. TG2]MEA9391323.1 hypothetical protein [Acerihabitans sp. TG2]
MKKSAFIIIVATLLGLVGCTTPPMTTVQPTLIPPERTLGFQTNVNNGATIVVNRDSEFLSGAGCLLSVLIDGKTAANIAAGETGRFFVEPGQHIVGVSGGSLADGHCAIQPAQPPVQSVTVVNSGQVQKFRISGGENTALAIRPTSL